MKSLGNYVCREVLFLCEIINKFGTRNPDDGTVTIKFGLLFEVYAYYSDKVRLLFHVECYLKKITV